MARHTAGVQRTKFPNQKRLKFFDKDMIEWKKHLDLEEFYKTLLTFHRTHPALHAKAEVFRLNTSTNTQMFLLTSGKKITGKLSLSSISLIILCALTS